MTTPTTILRPEDDYYPLCLIFDEGGTQTWVEVHLENIPQATITHRPFQNEAGVREMCRKYYPGYMVVNNGHNFQGDFVEEDG